MQSHELMPGTHFNVLKTKVRNGGVNPALRHVIDELDFDLKDYMSSQSLPG